MNSDSFSYYLLYLVFGHMVARHGQYRSYNEHFTLKLLYSLCFQYFK